MSTTDSLAFRRALQGIADRKARVERARSIADTRFGTPAGVLAEITAGFGQAGLTKAMDELQPEIMAQDLVIGQKLGLTPAEATQFPPGALREIYGKKLAEKTPERTIISDVAGFKRYVDTGERVFPGAVPLEKDPLVSVNLGEDSKKAGTKKLAEKIGERADQRYTYASSAQQQNADLDRLDLALARGAETGAGQEFLLDIKNLGSTLFGIEFPETAQESEIIRTISNKMALRLRNPESGLGLTGSTSNKDLQFLKDSVIGLNRSEGGNRLLIDLMKKYNDLAVATAEEQQRIIDQEGGVPLNLDTRLMKFVNGYQVLTPEEKKVIQQYKSGEGLNINDPRVKKALELGYSKRQIQEFLRGRK